MAAHERTTTHTRTASGREPEALGLFRLQTSTISMVSPQEISGFTGTRMTHCGVIRPYRPDDDAAALWDLKQQFEHELGQNTGGEQKATRYASKLNPAYRDRYLKWARTCTAQEDCILLAVDDGDVLGYVFVLPEQFAMIWDAAVLNELFVVPSHRGTDVATALMEGAIAVAEAQDLPLDRLVLDVDRANDRAKAFYRKFDFDHWGELVARPL